MSQRGWGSEDPSNWVARKAAHLFLIESSNPAKKLTSNNDLITDLQIGESSCKPFTRGKEHMDKASRVQSQSDRNIHYHNYHIF